MRVQLSYPYTSLKKMLELEGDQVTDTTPDILLTRDLLDKENHPSNCLVIGGDWYLPRDVLNALDVEVDKTGRYLGTVSKWLDTTWSTQTILGVPLCSLMNEDLGPSCPSGYACRFVHDSRLDEYFDNPKLESLLKDLKYTGFVSFSFGVDKSNEVVVTRVETGIPNRGFFNILESTKDKLSSFLTQESPILMESWTISLLISRAPYPFKPLDIQKAYVKNPLSRDVLKHLYFFNLESFKKTFSTTSLEVGIATSWANTLSEAGRRVLRTCRNLGLEEKQFRTDVVSYVSTRWHELQSLDLLGV